MDENKEYRFVEGLRAPERLEKLKVERVAELSLEGVDAAHVLDVGAGSGVFAEAFAALGKEVSGLDKNPKMIESAKRHVPQAVFRLGSAEAIPWPDRSFDLVFLGLVLHEMKAPLTALRESRRIARARVVILEWPYIAQEFGPPLSHRLRSGDILEMSISAGFQRFDMIPLANTILYRLGIHSHNPPSHLY